MVDVRPVLADLDAESAEVDSMVAGLDAGGWARPTPAQGWTIAHQIAHLAWTDRQAITAVTSPDEFARQLEHAAKNPLGYVDEAAEEWAATPPPEQLARWRAGRSELSAALAAVPAGQKIAWYGPPMSAPSMATARLMETWAHGQDVADTLGVERVPTARLRHVAHLGVRTRDFAFAVHQRPAPAEPFRVELTGPGGELWTWGPDDAAQRVTGNGHHFCLLAAQRRHRDDCDLKAVGADADEWLNIVQAFAGPAGSGREATGVSA